MTERPDHQPEHEPSGERDGLGGADAHPTPSGQRAPAEGAAGAPAEGGGQAPVAAPGWDAVPASDSLRGDGALPTSMTAGVAAGSVGPTVPGQQPYLPGTPGAPTPRRRMRKGVVAAIVAGAAALVLLVVASGVAYSVGSADHSADRPVQAFLQDVEDGHLSDALEAAGIDRDRDDVLLTDAAYAEAGDKITAHRITSVEQRDDRATVRALLTQAGRSVPATFELERAGTDWGVFPVWELQPPSLGTVSVVVQGPARSAVTVAGADVTTSRLGAVSLRALPGSYGVRVDGGEWFTAEDATAAVRGFGAPSEPVTLATGLTDAGKQAASKAVDAWVDGCVASTSTAPDGCSFYAYGENPANTYTNQRWTLGSRPSVDVGAWSVQGWLVRTESAGSATFTADFTGPAGRGRATAGPIDINASGWITAFSDDGATFVPAVGNGQGDSGS